MKKFDTVRMASFFLVFSLLCLEPKFFVVFSVSEHTTVRRKLRGVGYDTVGRLKTDVMNCKEPHSGTT